MRSSTSLSSPACTASGKSEQFLALPGGAVGELREVRYALEVHVRLRHCTRDCERGSGGVELRRQRGRSHLLDERSLPAPEIEVPCKVESNPAIPEKRVDPAEGGGIEVVAADLLPIGTHVEIDLGTVTGAGDHRLFPGAPDARERRTKARVVGERLSDQPVELRVAQSEPPVLSRCGIGRTGQAQRRGGQPASRGLPSLVPTQAQASDVSATSTSGRRRLIVAFRL